MYKYNLKHYWNYFRVNFIISLKNRFEYKVNFYGAVLAFTSNYVVLLFFGSLFLSIIGNEINWDYTDYVLFIFLTIIIRYLSGMFWFSKSLKMNIIRGHLNAILSKPGQPILNHILKGSPNWSFLLPIVIVIFLPYLYANISTSIFLLLLSLPIIIMLVILEALIYAFLGSLSFHFLDFGHKLTHVYEDSEDMSYSFPGQLFEGSRIEFLVLMYPMYFCSTVLVPLIQNKAIVNLEYKLFTIIMIIMFLLLGTVVNWHYGLNKYDGYN